MLRTIDPATQGYSQRHDGTWRRRHMIIAIDYDDTYTADPHLWQRFIGDAQRSGHVVICVTGRKELPDFTRDPPLPGSVQIVLTAGAPKREAASKQGWSVNVWIDDMPEMIGASKILDFGDVSIGG